MDEVTSGESVAIDLLGDGFRLRDHPSSWVSTLAVVLEDCPPILVHADTLRIVDGYGRVAAARMRGWSHMPVVWIEGDESTLLLAAVRANRHGQPLRPSERRAAVKRLLETDPDLSNRTVAATCGVAQRTVADVRKTISPLPGASPDAPGPGRRRGRDGKTYPERPEQQRERIVAAILDDRAAPDAQIARLVGCSPSTVADVRATLVDAAPPSAGGPGASSPSGAMPDESPMGTSWLVRLLRDVLMFLRMIFRVGSPSRGAAVQPDRHSPRGRTHGPHAVIHDRQ